MTATYTKPNGAAPAPITSDYTIYFDGGAEPNPGIGYGSYDLVSHSTGRTIRGRIQKGGWLGTQTNNEAEYMTLIGALEHLICVLLERGKATGTLTLTICGDAQLVLNQLAGKWSVGKENLIPLHADARSLVARFKQVAYVWQPREEMVKRFGH